MEITQDKINLISKLVKNDRKYSGNEDLYDDFLNEACRRSAAIINSISNENALEAYLRKVVTTSVLNVLKESGRLRRSKSGYMSTKEVSLNTEYKNVSNTVETDYSSCVIDYGKADISVTPEENAINNEILEFVIDTIREIDAREPEKLYWDIFQSRYHRDMTQREIASELNISQSEISKRLYGLIDRVKSVLDEQ